MFSDTLDCAVQFSSFHILKTDRDWLSGQSMLRAQSGLFVYLFRSFEARDKSWGKRMRRKSSRNSW